MNHLIDSSRRIPVRSAALTCSYSPVALEASERPTPLEVRVTAPAAGTGLPLVLLSHGHGPSLYLPSKDGYGPLASFLAEQGFVVIQPSHANSKVAGLPKGAPGAPLFWRERVEEMRLILDQLQVIEEALPSLAGRVNHELVGAIGHSLGGQTVGMLLGARLTDPKEASATEVDLRDERVKAGVLLAAPGNGGNDLSQAAAENYSALNPDFSTMITPALVVYGDADVSPHLTTRGADWHADPYYLSPGAEWLLTLTGAGHGLGGVAGYDAKETDDENPDRLEAVRRLVSSYLRAELLSDESDWTSAQRELQESASLIGRIDRKVNRDARIA